MARRTAKTDDSKTQTQTQPQPAPMAREGRRIGGRDNRPRNDGKFLAYYGPMVVENLDTFVEFHRDNAGKVHRLKYGDPKGKDMEVVGAAVEVKAPGLSYPFEIQTWDPAMAGTLRALAVSGRPIRHLVSPVASINKSGTIKDAEGNEQENKFVGRVDVRYHLGPDSNYRPDGRNLLKLGTIEVPSKKSETGMAEVPACGAFISGFLNAKGVTYHENSDVYRLSMFARGLNVVAFIPRADVEAEGNEHLKAIIDQAMDKDNPKGAYVAMFANVFPRRRPLQEQAESAEVSAEEAQQEGVEKKQVKGDIEFRVIDIPMSIYQPYAKRPVAEDPETQAAAEAEQSAPAPSL